MAAIQSYESQPTDFFMPYCCRNSMCTNSIYLMCSDVFSYLQLMVIEKPLCSPIVVAKKNKDVHSVSDGVVSSARVILFMQLT